MKPASFRYYRPRTVEEAVSLLAKTAPDNGRIIAGGQSLVPMMAYRIARPEHLIDINRIASLKKLAVEDGALVIGANVRHAAFDRPIDGVPCWPVLAQIGTYIGHYPIRTRGTFCGSIAHADPASEWGLVAATFGATVVARNAGGTRSIAIEDYFQGAMVTALADDELLIEIRLCLPAADARFGFNEFSRRGGDFALAMALAGGRVLDGVIADPRIGVGGVEECPRRLDAAEAVLAGKAPSDAAFREAAEAAAAAVEPMDDGRLGAGYRRDLVRSVTRRALENAFA